MQPDIEVEWLPPYAPDLNPEEGCHGNVEQHPWNAAPADICALCAQVDRRFACFRQHADLFPGFLGHAGRRVNQLW